MNAKNEKRFYDYYTIIVECNLFSILEFVVVKTRLQFAIKERKKT